MRTSFKTTERKRISFTGPRYFSKYGANKVRAQKRKFSAVQPCDRANVNCKQGAYAANDDSRTFCILMSIFDIFQGMFFVFSEFYPYENTVELRYLVLRYFELHSGT